MEDPKLKHDGSRVQETWGQTITGTQVVGSANLLNFSKTCAGNSRAGRLPNASSDVHVGKDDRWAIPSSLSRGNERAEIKFYRKDDEVAAVPSQSSAATGNGECGEGAGTKSVFHHPRSGLKGLAARMRPRTKASDRNGLGLKQRRLSDWGILVAQRLGIDEAFRGRRC